MCGEADGYEDADVAAAAAEVAVESFSDLSIGGLGRAFEQDNRAEDHSRDTVAALHGLGFEEGLLDAMEPAVAGKAFDGSDLLTFGEAGRGKAGGDWFAVEEDGTGATLAFAAAVFGADEVEVFTEDFEEWPVLGGVEGVGLAVDGSRHDRECIARGWSGEGLE